MVVSFLRRIALVACVGIAIGASHAQVVDGRNLVDADLIAFTDAVVPGQSFQVGLRMKMADGWHTYWEYPGDAGIPTAMDWELPDGFVAGPIEWPIPRAKLEPGDIEVYGYSGEVIFPITIQVPDDLVVGETVTLSGRASWLVCEEICIPGNASISITLPVRAAAQSVNTEILAKWQGLVPSANAPPFNISWEVDNGRITGSIASQPGVSDIRFFPLPSENQVVGHPSVEVKSDGSSVIQLAATPPLRGVVAARMEDEDRAWIVMVDVPPSAVASDTVGSQSAPLGFPPLWQALLFGFLGGIILNLMPCVLPVISLKIFGFIRQAGDDPRQILLHGLAFSGGIFLWFLGLGVVIVALKAGGSEVTWAFQFQNPVFILIIAAVVFVFALNLCGVFELVLPGRAVGSLSELGAKEGFSGSFFQGVFATLLATPCTGPFLGTALGFAFSQPGVVVMAMFGSVAFGMASPYLLLSARPGWMKFLPKPGAWMEKLKQFMAFPLFATLLWLLSILGGQRGLDGVIYACAFLLSLGLAVWIYGAFCGPLSSVRSRGVAIAAVLFVSIGGGWLFLGQGFAKTSKPDSAGSNAVGGIAWVPFSQAALDDLLAQGKPVFVDFTADWCITCKFNERTAINVPGVREKIESLGVIPMKADWTNSNPEITAALKSFGRVGVPFYVLYPAGRASEPITLPEILTETMVLEALEKAR